MPPLDPAQWEEVRRRVRQGETVSELARGYGVHPSTVHRRLAAMPAAKSKSAKPKSAAKPLPQNASATKRKVPADSKPERLGVGSAKASARRPPAAIKVRRQLIGRLYRAIDTKLKLMERRMNNEIHALDALSGNSAGPADESVTLTAADHERETRAFGALVKTINSVRQMQAELEHLANADTPSTSAADARLAADADRYRRDIAERLAKFVPPRS